MDHYDLTDDEFARQFSLATLNPHCFTHEAHLRLAFILIKRHGIDEASELLCEQIAFFDQTHGDGNKYHRTLTIAAAKIVHHFMQRTSSKTFPDLLYEFPRLKSNFRELLEAHYSFALFKRPEAKSKYLEPDILPFT